MHTQVVYACLYFAYKCSSRCDYYEEAAEGANCCNGDNTQNEEERSECLYLNFQLHPLKSISLRVGASRSCCILVSGFVHFISQIALYKPLLFIMHS